MGAGRASRAGRSSPARRGLLAGGSLAAALAMPLAQPAQIRPALAQTAGGAVDLELVLAVDISASVDDAEYGLQTAGIARALRDPEVGAAIESLGAGGIAVAVMPWSRDAVLAVGWTRLDGAPAAERLAARIEGLPRARIGVTTGIGTALARARALLGSNGFEGRRRAVDVSGDGKNNSGLPLWVERNRTLAAGVTINGLTILDDDPTLADYYANHVIGGPGAFLVTAAGFEDFARAFREKLLREIGPPAPQAAAPVPDAAPRADAREGLPSAPLRAIHGQIVASERNAQSGMRD